MSRTASGSDLDRALQRLIQYQERHDFGGYDPYDALNGWVGRLPLGKWPPILATQLLKRLPLNIRPILGIPPARNPKGIGLFLQGYSILSRTGGDERHRRTAQALFEWLATNVSPGYSGAAWGYNFDWASPVKRLPAFAPSVVVTAFIAKGLLAYHEATGLDAPLRLARDACEFVLKDLPVNRTDEGLCFSYTPLMADCCYNASLLGAEVLARVGARTGEARLMETAAEAVRFVVAHQHDDGHWDYSIDIATGRERRQVDFHQGFILDSLFGCLAAMDDAVPALVHAIERGARFYAERQFHYEGRSYWRLPREWPVDIHHQAQGILTFSRLSARWPQYGPLARRIADWTIKHMQRGDGAFGYRIGRFGANRISYMRWGQAWMFLALTVLLHDSEGVG